MHTDARICDAFAACEEHDAELYVVWAGPVGAGAFVLPAALATAVDCAAERGIRATSAVRFGNHEVVLREGAVIRPAEVVRGVSRPTPHLRSLPEVIAR